MTALLSLAVLEVDLSKTWASIHSMTDTVMTRLPSLVLGIVVFLLFFAASKVAKWAVQRIGFEHTRHNVRIVFGRLLRLTIVIVGLLVALTIVAPSFRAGDLIKVLGIGSVAIGFAFQNILQNFLAGLLLLWTEPFRIDDQIKVDDFEGTVEEIQTRATFIRTYDGRRVVIPNADLFTRSVTVNTAYDKRRWEYDICIGSAEDIDGLKKALLDAIRGVEGVISDPAPLALTLDLGDSADEIKLRLLWWTEPPRQKEMLLSHDQVLTAVKNKLREMGMEHSAGDSEKSKPTSDSATKEPPEKAA